MITKEKMIFKQFKALGDEKRLQIISLIQNNKDFCAGDFLKELDMSQSTLSHHMKILVDANVIDYTKTGTMVHYSINEDAIKGIISYLRKLKG